MVKYEVDLLTNVLKENEKSIVAFIASSVLLEWVRNHEARTRTRRGHGHGGQQLSTGDEAGHSHYFIYTY